MSRAESKYEQLETQPKNQHQLEILGVVISLKVGKSEKTGFPYSDSISECSISWVSETGESARGAEVCPCELHANNSDGSESSPAFIKS